MTDNKATEQFEAVNYIYDNDERELGLFKKLGEGQTGEVWLARYSPPTKQVRFQTKPTGWVAVKVMHAFTPFAIAKLAQEAQALTILMQSANQHPNIIKVYDFFQYPAGAASTARLYLIMEYCPWQSLADVNLSRDDVLYCLIQTCQGLDFIHSYGILHRDLKPSNILLGQDGKGMLVTKLTDFGQAFVPPELGGAGFNLYGSLWYTSPEILRGEDGGASADIYSVGALAYKLLTKQEYLPFTKDRNFDYELIINRPTPVIAPREIPGIKLPLKIELENSILKALSFDPGERFQSAAEMQNALENVLYGKARVAVGNVVGSTANKSSPPSTTAQLASGDKLEEAWREGRFRQLPVIQVSANAAVSTVAFSRDNQYLAVGCNKIIEVRDMRSQGANILQTLTGIHPVGGVATVAFNNGQPATDNTLMLAGSSMNTVKIWDARSGQEMKTFKPYTGPILQNSIWWVNGIEFSPDGQTLVACSDDKTIGLWEVASGRLIRTIKGHTKFISGISFSPDGRLLVSCSWDKTVKLWEVASGQLYSTLPTHADMVLRVKFSPDGKNLVSASADGTLKLWEVETGRVLHTYYGHQSWVISVAFGLNGRLIASGSEDKTIKIWSATTGELLHTLAAHSEKVRSVTFSPDNRWLVSGSNDGTVRRFVVQ